MHRSAGRRFLPLILLSVLVTPVHAGMIGMDQLLEQGARERLVTELEKEDVQQQLVELGVDPVEAKQRVQNMTDTEVARLNQQVASMPAGGHVSNRLLAVLLIILLILAI